MDPVNPDLLFVVTAALSLAGVIGGVVARDRQITRMIADGDKELHARVNRVREDMVRRSDLDGHLLRVDEAIKELRSELRESRKETTMRLDAILAAVKTGS